MTTEPTTDAGAEERQAITAYEIYGQTDMPILPAPINRQWMDDTASRFAYRCLPLTVANQSGWVICNPSSFCARWNGGPRTTDTVLVFDDAKPDDRISSLFGHGTVTFNLPYLMRTPAGINLWVKGPTNWPKHGVQALEGVVETDWTAASFTMNWKLTRPQEMVRFDRGEPICMLVPVPRHLVGSLDPQRQPLSENPELAADYQRWSQDRDDFQRLVAEGDPDATRVGWQKDYFQGRDPGRDRFEGHQTHLGVRHFSPIPDRNADDGNAT